MIRRHSAFLLLALAAPLAAQNPPAATAAADQGCSLELMQPQPIGIANLQRTKVVNAKTPDEATRAIRDAMKLLFDGKAASNPNGRDMLLGQFFILALPYGEVQTRGNLGMPGDKNAPVDLLVAADSVFQIVEQADPKCTTDTDQWRQYAPYQTKVQGAYKAMSAGHVDSAEMLAKRAIILYREGAQPYDVLWRVARERKDEAGQIANLRMAADKLIGDTLNSNVRANFLFNLGRIQQEFAALKTDAAAKKTLYADAAKAYMQVVKEFPAAEETPFALQGISMSAQVSGDSATARAAVDVVMGARDKYGDVTLAQAGVIATAGGRIADAAELFEAAAKKNPHLRDYQYNYAAMLYEAKRSAEMLPVVRKLVELDPSNSDNVMLFAYAFSGLSAKEPDAAKKRVLIDSVAHYQKLADEMPHRLSYTEFDRLKDTTTLRGQVENKAKTARSFTIEFEFLGKDGEVIAKQTATVANVAPSAVGEFTVELAQGGVWGVRYAALPLR